MIALLILPAVPHMIYRLTLDPFFPTTHNFVWDWANHAHSFTVLMIGFLFAKDAAFWGAVRRALLPAIGLAILLAAGLTLVWQNWELVQGDDAPFAAALWPARMARILYAWIAIVSLLALAQRYLNRPGKALTYMTEAVFPWYILHQTIIVMAGFWLTRQGLDVWSEFALVTLATIGGCALLHEFAIRRVNWLRPWFGLKPKRRKPAVSRPALAE